MITLGIETSCDETACAVIKGRDEILSNIISSSLFKHQEFGGVVPEIASRYSLEQIDVVYEQALKQAGIKSSDIDLVAVTCGPGLIGSLLVGVCFAKALSYRLNVPLVGVNHLEAHLVANFLFQKGANGSGKSKAVPSEYIGLLVSGGHTSISYHKKDKISLLGETVDDAVGEAYDKVAKILGLGFPGGPVIDKLAKEGNPKAYSFTKPKQENPYDFSFSGIKTAALYTVQKFQKESPSPEKWNAFVRDISASFQSAVTGWLVDKTITAALQKKVKNIIVGGGVSANSELRKRLVEEGAKLGIEAGFPPMSLTIDNAAMIARRGVEMFQKKKPRNSLRLTGKPSFPMASVI